jgi:oxalate decarboxylase/phosphoglucose isomerase-like protein (cupin superfamily)
VEWFVDFYNQVKEQEVPVMEVIQRPGEIIFVPHGWFHVVLNLEDSFAVTHNYVSETNLYHVMKFLDQKPDQVSGVSESKKHQLGPKFRQSLKEKAPAILKTLEEREEKVRAPSTWDLTKEGSGFSLFG